MGMDDQGVVKGVSHPYVAKGHLVSGQVKEKEVYFDDQSLDDQV